MSENVIDEAAKALEAMLRLRRFRCDCVGSPAAKCPSCRSELADRGKAESALASLRNAAEGAVVMDAIYDGKRKLTGASLPYAELANLFGKVLVIPIPEPGKAPR